MNSQDIAFGHTEYALSELDLRMIKPIPQGGNWKHIPKNIPSKRLDRIRETGGRTTLYGRMSWNNPSYTITTYFNRPGNGTYVHPEYDRVITSLEAARLQSFPDSYIFMGSKGSRTKQIGNAVPPLLAFAIAKSIKFKNTQLKTAIDLFAGAGGMSLGFNWAGFKTIAANDNFREASITYQQNHPNTTFIPGDITDPEVKKSLLDVINRNNGVDLVIGGPPCQGFSHAGKRLIDDPRNVLYKEFVEVVKLCKPKVLVMENVEGILSMRKGLAFNEIKVDFEKLGYRVEGRKLIAAEYGVPQKRKRVIIIGTIHDNPSDFFPTPILTKNHFLTVKDAIGDIPGKLSKDVYQSVNLKKSNSIYQELMRSKINVNQFMKTIESQFL